MCADGGQRRRIPLAQFHVVTAQNTDILDTHYFLLGMVFFLLLLLLEKSFSFTDAKTGRVLVIYLILIMLSFLYFVNKNVLFLFFFCSIQRKPESRFVRFCICMS